jgi:FHA domain-containing protein
LPVVYQGTVHKLLRLKERPPLLTLIALNGQEKGRVFQLTGETTELLGRQAPVLKLSDAQTSRRHAEIILQNNTWLIRDLDSTNGTWVNGQKIAHITELEAGDRIVVGRHQFRVSEVSDLPAPTPQPQTPQPEPAIGGEALAAMGVDLSESLSADLLEEDGELPALPDDALADGRDDLEAPGVPVAPGTPGLPSAIIEEPTSPPKAAPDGEDDDNAVIDLDALLADDGPAAPVDSPPDEPAQAADDIELPKPTKKPEDALPQTDDGVIDLDAVLDDVTPAAPATPDVTPEPPTDAAPEAPPADVPGSNIDDELDLDVLLGPGEEAGEAPPTDKPADEPGIDAGDEPGVEPGDEPGVEALIEDAPSTDTPPSAQPEAPIGGSDSVIDLDALLEETRDTTESTEPTESVIDTADRLDDADADEQAHVDDDAAPDTETEDDQPTPAKDSKEPDSLIDIDILASATPATSFTAADDEALPPVVSDSDAETPADEAKEEAPPADAFDAVLDNLPDALDEQPETGPTGDDEPISEDEPVVAEVAGGEDEDVAVVSVPEEGEEAAEPLSEVDRNLLLSPDEQAQAVSGYRKAKVMTVVVLIMCVAALGAAGWWGVNHFINQADATSLPMDQETEPSLGLAGVADIPHANDLDEAAEQPAPGSAATDTHEPTAGVHTPSAEIPADNLPTTPDIPTTEENTTPPDSTVPLDSPDSPIPDDTSSADPFADINLPADDPANAVKQADQPGMPVTPGVDSPQIEVPDAEAGQADTPTVLASPDQADGSVSADDTGVDQVAGLLPVGVTDTTSDEVTATTPDQAESVRSELDLLTAAIDAQPGSGDRAAEQAIFVGARKVVYIVDASGSLVDSFPRVLDELDLAIFKLPEDRAFTVLFFGSEGVTEVPPVGLRWADGPTKRRIRDWIAPDKGNVTAWGRGDPMEALQRAVGYKPDEIVFLSDNLIGRQSTQEEAVEFLDRIAELTGDVVEQIHAVQFFDRDPQQVLKRIAERFNGTYNLISALPRRSPQTSVDEPLY